MDYENSDVWRRFREQLWIAILLFALLMVLLAFFVPRVDTIVAASIGGIASVLAVMAWRAADKRSSAWFIASSALTLVVAALCLIYLPP
ncbi:MULTISPECIES: hypothetical protein [unclassified Crossiella]|uniref:hypothetical protein n=1 Tax=unclassified Crossiella TaxID=2620835 RepID=UPI001FFFFD4E|nr:MULTISPECIES: hypothetical protein [unclassified Crossiella]MCK2236591.1 hypothetical protein [Crossiella sp. S99.2]MCK2250258.1 hypothetical protein [Crossiella sp. S99.1]